MPGALVERYVLDDVAVAFDEQMTRNLLAGDFLEIRMSGRIELVREKPVDPRPAEFTGRQRYAMQDDQLRPAARWPLVAIWRWHLAGTIDKPGFLIDSYHSLVVPGVGLSKKLSGETARTHSRTITEMYPGST